jgi:hypothetical protein
MAGTNIALRITNSLDHEVTLGVEPWGDQYKMASGATFLVEAQGPDQDLLEIEYGPNSITVYGWPGSTVALTETKISAEG